MGSGMNELIFLFIFPKLKELAVLREPFSDVVGFEEAPPKLTCFVVLLGAVSVLNLFRSP